RGELLLPRRNGCDRATTGKSRTTAGCRNRTSSGSEEPSARLHWPNAAFTTWLRLGLTRPDAVLLRVSAREDHGLLVDNDHRHRIALAVQQITPTIDVLALLDSAMDRLNKGVILNQDWQRGVTTELVAQSGNRDLPFAQWGAITDICR